jgi:hypothetical protein
MRYADASVAKRPRRDDRLEGDDDDDGRGGGGGGGGGTPPCPL